MARSSDFELGDTVRVIDVGECYTTFPIMFKQLGFKNTVENKYFEGIGVVFGVGKNPTGESVVAIRNDLGNEMLIAVEGVEKLVSMQRNFCRNVQKTISVADIAHEAECSSGLPDVDLRQLRLEDQLKFQNMFDSHYDKMENLIRQLQTHLEKKQVELSTAKQYIQEKIKAESELQTQLSLVQQQLEEKTMAEGELQTQLAEASSKILMADLVDALPQLMNQHNLREMDFQKVCSLEKILKNYAFQAEKIREEFQTTQDCCCICQDKNKSILFLPCRHMCTCSTCSASVESCPICRKTITQKIEAFL